ncbi:MAG TPA: hypothetical protein VMV40_06405 [Acidiferrobacter sp.]|nr:hypothetical protein [Acidiferrobacter sp.]
MNSNPKPALSDYLARLPSSPELFPFFYRGLISLHFPIDVAEILELRYLSHHIIDHAENDGQGHEFGEFAAARGVDMDSIHIRKAGHRERLSQLLFLIREYHLAHVASSSADELRLQAAINENQFAQHQSKRYGKTASVLLMVAALGLILSNPPVALAEGLMLVLSYLSLDYFYSLSLLKREERILGVELHEALRRRVRTVNWKSVVRQTAVILGYARPLGGEAFRMEAEPERQELEGMHSI